MKRGAWVGVVVMASACGGAKEPAAPLAQAADPVPPGVTADAPIGPWLTATETGALRVRHPARWTCSETAPTGRTFTIGARAECLLPIEFLSYQVFGCPDTVTHGTDTERATYDARGRLLTFGPRPDYQTTYTWDGDVPVTRDGRKVTVTRDGATVRWDEEGIVTTYELDAQQRPIEVKGPAQVKLTWAGDDLASTDWHMAGLDDMHSDYVTCRGTTPAASLPAPAKVEKIALGPYEGFDQTSLSMGRLVDALDREPWAQVRACYRTVLARDAAAHGDLALTFTVGPEGRLLAASADGFDASLVACVRAAMATWTVPIPLVDGAPAEARFALTLVLSPSCAAPTCGCAWCRSRT